MKHYSVNFINAKLLIDDKSSISRYQRRLIIIDVFFYGIGAPLKCTNIFYLDHGQVIISKIYQRCNHSSIN